LLHPSIVDRPRWAGEALKSPASVVAVAVGVRGFPVSGGGDHGGGALVSPPRPSYRDVEGLLAERGVQVDHVTVYRWVQRCTPLVTDAARFARHSPGDRWFVDETYVKVHGQ